MQAAGKDAVSPSAMYSASRWNSRLDIVLYSPSSLNED